MSEHIVPVDRRRVLRDEVELHRLADDGCPHVELSEAALDALSDAGEFGGVSIRRTEPILLPLSVKPECREARERFHRVMVALHDPIRTYPFGATELYLRNRGIDIRDVVNDYFMGFCEDKI